ncbi:MAG: phosphate/phosphite/phosphonate ABC transporter substrate-binding protein [Bacteroidota bacterium]
MNHQSTVQTYVALVVSVLIFGCTKPSGSVPGTPIYGNESAFRKSVPQYTFAVHPLHNSQYFFEVYQPLISYINKHTDEFTLRLEASKDYAQFENKLNDRIVEFAVPNPYQSVLSIEHGYSIVGKMGDDDRFYGIIVVRKDSRITSVNDLRNSTISFPSATALAAAMMPKYFLQSNGLNIAKDVNCSYVGTQESSIMNVYLGKTKAGCTWPPPWESFLEAHPEMNDALTVQWRTEPLINNGLVVRNDVPARHTEILTSLLYSMHTNDEGKAILKKIKLSRYEPIAQKEYVSRVNTFMVKYRKMFGSLPETGRKK